MFMIVMNSNKMIHRKCLKANKRELQAIWGRQQRLGNKIVSVFIKLKYICEVESPLLSGSLPKVLSSLGWQWWPSLQEESTKVAELKSSIKKNLYLFIPHAFSVTFPDSIRGRLWGDPLSTRRTLKKIKCGVLHQPVCVLATSGCFKRGAWSPPGGENQYRLAKTFAVLIYNYKVFKL